MAKKFDFLILGFEFTQTRPKVKNRESRLLYK